MSCWALRELVLRWYNDDARHVGYSRHWGAFSRSWRATTALTSSMQSEEENSRTERSNRPFLHSCPTRRRAVGAAYGEVYCASFAKGGLSLSGVFLTALLWTQPPTWESHND